MNNLKKDEKKQILAKECFRRSFMYNNCILQNYRNTITYVHQEYFENWDHFINVHLSEKISNKYINKNKNNQKKKNMNQNINNNIKGIIGLGTEKNEKYTFIDSFNLNIIRRKIEIKFDNQGYILVGVYSDFENKDLFFEIVINDNEALDLLVNFKGLYNGIFSLSSTEFFFCLKDKFFFQFLDSLILKFKNFEVLKNVKSFFFNEENFDSVFKTEKDLEDKKIEFFIDNFKFEIPLFIKCPENTKFYCFLFKPHLIKNKIGLYFLKERILRVDYDQMKFFVSKNLPKNDFRIKNHIFTKNLLFFIALFLNFFFIFFFIKKNLYWLIDEMNQANKKLEFELEM